jgi:hypothetical protein
MGSKRSIIVMGDCDREMLHPQPTRWTSGAANTIAALVSAKWDEISLYEKDSAEEIAIFLRDNPWNCPPVIVLSWVLDPILQVKIKLWLTGKVYDWDAKPRSDG